MLESIESRGIVLYHRDYREDDKLVKIFTEQEGKWDRAKGLEIAENLLAANKNLNVVVSNNDEMAIGAVSTPLGRL